MVYSLIEGTLLAFMIHLVLRLVPRKSSGTRFTIWFSTLLAVTILPFLTWSSPRTGAAISASRLASRHELFTVPASWAAWAFLAWAVIAMAGLLRVAVGFWQVFRLRKSCAPIDLRGLDPEVQKIVEHFRQSRPVLIGTSARLHVPTAIGFWKPVVLLPAWFVAEISATELKHILLHELAHLRRRDDWTNLVQKLVKALMFFHPLVWWIERKLSLERELACDDAVLVQTESPRIYAQCLARVAEKSFLRRQIALAQAAVSRMHQLSSRVAQILDLERPRTTRLWKPAVPLVAGFTLLCVLSLRQGPALVGFADERPSGPTATVSAMMNAVPTAVKTSLAGNDSHPAVTTGMGTQFINAGFKLGRERRRSIPTKAVKHRPQFNLASGRAETAPPTALVLASYSGYMVEHEAFIVTMTSQGIQSGQWKVQVWQLRVLVPASQTGKPTPRKT
jgi:beta-lactamase regulating signal transducer with metallopeptidase domain